MPVYGGDRLLRELRRRQAGVRAMPRAVEVGVFGDAAIDALMNEFGVPNANPPIPERPALRLATRAALRAMLAETRKRSAANGGFVTVADAKAIGTILLRQMATEIAQIGPPNRPWKRPSKPLVLTGRLLKSLGIKVIK